MGLFQFKPSRTGAGGKPPGPVLADLDALVTEPVPFKLFGKTWQLRPVTTKQLFLVMDKLSQLENLRFLAKEINGEAIVDGYFNLFNQVCPELTRDDVGNMSQAQCISLLQLIVDSVSGKAQVELEKKKKAMLEAQAAPGTQPPS